MQAGLATQRLFFRDIFTARTDGDRKMGRVTTADEGSAPWTAPQVSLHDRLVVLGQNVMNDLAAYIREAEVATLEAVG
ncbi:MAG: hypothetical protein ACI8QS_000209 [Planctomycetota bacterium]|jgi:hypothetical protein